MGRHRNEINPDRYLSRRDGWFHYKRNVPENLAHLDERAPRIRATLKTRDLALARSKRDAFEAADDALWASMLMAEPQDPARARHAAAVRRAEAMGFTYRTAGYLAQSASISDILTRLETIEIDRTPLSTAKAVSGLVEAPPVVISDAFEIYCNEIVADELVGKSAVQKAQWKKVKLRAVNNFIDMVSDKAMEDISRDDAMNVYRHWLKRIVPPKGAPATHSASSGNRDIGNLRVLYEVYFKHVGDDERKNPFAGLGFSSRKKRSRPPLAVDWIRDTIMKKGALATLNDEARGIVLALIETGARPSEIANLEPDAIRISHDVPHLAIEPRTDPDDPREIKTASSERLIPLVGVALEVFKKHAGGFPRYRNRENDLSAALNKYFRSNKLFPTTNHKIYSIRHSFEDRMKDKGLDSELRQILMGHAIDRPRYGSGGSLKWRQKELKRIALPFDPAIV